MHLIASVAARYGSHRAQNNLTFGRTILESRARLAELDRRAGSSRRARSVESTNERRGSPRGLPIRATAGAHCSASWNLEHALAPRQGLDGLCFVVTAGWLVWRLCGRVCFRGYHAVRRWNSLGVIYPRCGLLSLWNSLAVIYPS